ncbi:MAG: hypothetical protein ABJA02_01645 [Acidobacteriota bacterium]
MFESLSKPGFPNAALGLEREGVTAIAVQRQGKRRFGIKQAATIRLPLGVLMPSFLERNIGDVGELTASLMEAVQNAGMGGQKRWSVALPSNTARTAILTLDAEPVAKKETAEILDWKAEQSFGSPAAELRVLTRKISPSRDGRPRYFATAVKLSVIDEYETVFESLGWKAGLILPRAIGEANWLSGAGANADSLLISSQSDGFTALLLRGSEPYVVRSVTCAPTEIDDEVYRLLMFYNDRVKTDSGGLLEKMLLIGSDLVPERISEISTEALGRSLQVLTSDDVGLYLPDPTFKFDEIAAAAGLAALS